MDCDQTKSSEKICQRSQVTSFRFSPPRGFFSIWFKHAFTEIKPEGDWAERNIKPRWKAGREKKSSSLFPLRTSSRSFYSFWSPPSPMGASESHWGRLLHVQQNPNNSPSRRNGKQQIRIFLPFARKEQTWLKGVELKRNAVARENVMRI